MVTHSETLRHSDTLRDTGHSCLQGLDQGPVSGLGFIGSMAASLPELQRLVSEAQSQIGVSAHSVHQVQSFWFFCFLLSLCFQLFSL